MGTALRLFMVLSFTVFLLFRFSTFLMIFLPRLGPEEHIAFCSVFFSAELALVPRLLARALPLLEALLVF